VRRLFAALALCFGLIASAHAESISVSGGNEDAGSGTVNNCGSVGGLGYYASTGTAISCSNGITASNTALTLGSGVTLTLPDSSTASSAGLTGLTFLGVGPTAPAALVDVGYNISAPSWTTGGIAIHSGAFTYTDNSGSGTITTRAVNAFNTATFAASSAETITNAANLYLSPGPNAGANVTITNKWSLYATGAVGIFTSTTQAASAEIDVNQDANTATLTASATGAIVGRLSSITTAGSASTGSGGHVVGEKGLAGHNGTGTLDEAYGLEGALQNFTTGTINTAAAVNGYFQGNAASGTIGLYKAFTADSSGANSGTITQWVDYYSPSIGANGTGTMGSKYTLYNADIGKILYSVGPLELASGGSTPTPTTGTGYLLSLATAGVAIGGYGTSYDVLLQNRSGQSVFGVLANTEIAVAPNGQLYVGTTSAINTGDVIAANFQHNGATNISVQNASSGASASSVVNFGNSTSAAEVSMTLIGGSNTGGNGANSFTVNALAGMWLQGNGNNGLIIDASGNSIVPSDIMIGSATRLTLATGEVGLAKVAASGSAPGAAGLKFAAVCGSGAGTLKIIAYAGTSTTPVTIVDNVGASATGC
jgi:hypothetical protein